MSYKEVTKSPVFGAFLQAKLQTVAITAHHKDHVFVLSVLDADTHVMGLIL
jgi:hypothetical protein